MGSMTESSAIMNSTMRARFSGMLTALLIATGCSALSSLGGESIGETFGSDAKVVALTKAAVAGDADKVAKLVKEGANVNAVGNNGATPLVWALNAKNPRGVEALLKSGADPNLVTDKYRASPMYFLSGGNEPELLRLVLKYGGNPNHPGKGRIQERPLSVAASEGRIENIKMLLDAGADVNAHDQYNASAASVASAQANFDATALLLEHGFNFNLPYLARGVKGRVVPASSNRQHWKDKVIQMLKDRGVTVEP